MKNRAERFGFTLLELLVVMGVIGVLLAILLPQIMEARRQARTIQCVANYRGIGQTLLNYASDYDGTLPKKDAYGSHWGVVAYSASGWSGHGNPAIASFSLAGSPDIRGIVSGYVPVKYPFKTWQCTFIDGPPMGDLDPTTGNYRQTLGTAAVSSTIRGSLMLPFSTYYGNASAPGTAHESLMIQGVIDRGFADDVAGFPARVASANPGLVLAQDAYWDVPWNGAGLMQISHLKDGSMQGQNWSSVPGTCNNIVQGNTLQTNPTTNKTNKGSRMGLGATSVFYDGSARFVPVQELVPLSKLYDGNSGFRIWMVMP